MDNVDKKVDNFYGEPGECRKYQYFSILSIKMLSDYVNSLMHKKNPHTLGKEYVEDLVDNVDNSTCQGGFPPILYTSPAPIVINTSPWIQFFNKNSSISSNVEKIVDVSSLFWR